MCGDPEPLPPSVVSRGRALAPGELVCQPLLHEYLVAKGLGVVVGDCTDLSGVSLFLGAFANSNLDLTAYPSTRALPRRGSKRSSPQASIRPSTLCLQWMGSSSSWRVHSHHRPSTN